MVEIDTNDDQSSASFRVEPTGWNIISHSDEFNDELTISTTVRLLSPNLGEYCGIKCGSM